MRRVRLGSLQPLLRREDDPAKRPGPGGREMAGRVHDPFLTRRILTIGHSSRTLEDFLEMLRGPGVRAVVDVRRYPGSRRHPHFNRGELSTALLRHGVVYHHLGRDLGGRMEASFESYMLSAAFQRGLEMLQDLASTSVCAVMCAERDPENCHRRHLADALADRGWEVVHLLDPGTSRLHHPAEPQRRLF